MNERVVPSAPQLAPQLEMQNKLVQLRVAPFERTSPPSFRRYWLIGGLLALLLVAAAVAWSTLGGTSTVHYTTVPVTQGSVTPA